jgi:hypothetical protein
MFAFTDIRYAACVFLRADDCYNKQPKLVVGAWKLASYSSWK